MDDVSADPSRRIAAIGKCAYESLCWSAAGLHMWCSCARRCVPPPRSAVAAVAAAEESHPFLEAFPAVGPRPARPS